MIRRVAALVAALCSLSACAQSKTSDARPERAFEPRWAHPLSVLESDPDSFRRGSYDLFAWRELPGILIFRFKDYEAQDSYLKRLAFFVEKAGFRGTLAADMEIEDLHGWNAHDYRSSSIGTFFAKAEAEGFPLNRSELELKKLLLDLGVLVRGPEGLRGAPDRAIVSTSAESSPALERYFMVHELYHGIYFTDPEFAEGAERIYAAMDPGVKAFVLEYFDYKEYSLDDRDLLVNECMAYFLQQPPADAPEYFRRTVATILGSARGGRNAYQKRAAALKPEFLKTAKAYDALAKKLYGFRGGVAWR